MPPVHIFPPRLDRHKFTVLERVHRPVSKLYQKLYIITDSATIFTGISIILTMAYEISPIGYVRVQRNVKFHEIRKINFWSYTYHKIFILDRQTHRHTNTFQKITYRV